MMVAFAIYGYLKSLPKSEVSTWLPQLGTMIGAVGIATGLNIGSSIFYSCGTGFICAWGASSFYDLAFFWLTNKIKGWTGSPDKIVPMAISLVGVVTCVSFTGCPAILPLSLMAIQEAPSIIQTVENLVAASKNKPAMIEQVQTGLNALQTIPVIANAVPTAQAVQTALSLAGTPQLAPALTLPYQRAVLDSAGTSAPQRTISSVIAQVQTSDTLKP